ncbi:MAG: inositol monophosphatase [Clostridia bacterium]|nr:inositol monophosphatase [Clostridia bacterium]
MIDLHSLRDEAAVLVRQAGARIAASAVSPVHEKEGHYNYVTELDVAIQEFLRGGLSRLLPESVFFSEEQENAPMTDAYTWVVDPLDGTYNFIRSRRASAVSVALLKEKTPVLGLVYQPYHDELFTAVRGEGAFLNGMPVHVSRNPFGKALTAIGTSPYYAELADATTFCFREFLKQGGDIRRVGSAAVDCCDVACGRADVFCELRLSPWDFAAGALLITEAGGFFMMPYNERLDFSRPACILASNAECREQALRIVMLAKELIG